MIIPWANEPLRIVSPRRSRAAQDLPLFIVSARQLTNHGGGSLGDLRIGHRADAVAPSTPAGVAIAAGSVRSMAVFAAA